MQSSGRTPGRMRSAAVLAIVAVVPFACAAVMGSITFAVVRLAGFGHELGVSAVVAVVVLVANSGALALVGARDESDLQAAELPAAEAPMAQARAS